MAKLIKEKKYRFEVPEGKKKERLDLFLTHSIENATRSKVQKLIDADLVTVNGVAAKANYQVKPADVIEAVHPISPRPEDAEPEDIPLDIIYEDDYLIIINKPAGMVAHPAYANYTGTLVNALLHHTKKLSDLNEPGRPGIIHRLDKDTSGLLVVTKDDFTHAKIAEQFSKRTVDREYHAVCWGKFKEEKGEIAFNIVRSKKDRKKFSIPAHAERIFEPFFTNGSGGTGLGLFISRELCQTNGAMLAYEARAGGGSIFRIIFADPQRWTS